MFHIKKHLVSAAWSPPPLCPQVKGNCWHSYTCWWLLSHSWRTNPVCVCVYIGACLHPCGLIVYVSHMGLDVRRQLWLTVTDDTCEQKASCSVSSQLWLLTFTAFKKSSTQVGYLFIFQVMLCCIVSSMTWFLTPDKKLNTNDSRMMSNVFGLKKLLFPFQIMECFNNLFLGQTIAIIHSLNKTLAIVFFFF